MDLALVEWDFIFLFFRLVVRRPCFSRVIVIKSILKTIQATMMKRNDDEDTIVIES